MAKKSAKSLRTKEESRPKAAPAAAAKPPKAAAAQKPQPEPRRVPAAKPQAESLAVPPPAERYWEGVGRRKTAVARVRIFTRGEKGISVNRKTLEEYFRYPHLQRLAAEAVEAMKSGERFRVTVKVNGGGLHAQAEAIRHGTARALVLFNPDFRKRLKRAGFLRRDPRMKERKKFGLKGARRAPQWAKR